MTNRIHINNARLSFASVWKRAVFDGKEGKFEATLLIPKTDDKQIKILKAAIKGKVEESGLKISSEKFCMKDGDKIFEDKEYDGYQDTYALKASNNTRPTIVNRDGSQLAEDDNVIYSGCYVNAIIDFWVQNNNYGKRINANLLGLQFVRDGEAFGAGAALSADEFTPITGDEFSDEGGAEDF